jgi:hypothetical protein
LLADILFSAAWTPEGSQSCQYILGFNVRTIHVLAQLLGTELLDVINRQADSMNQTSTVVAQSEGKSEKFNAVLEAGLSLLRVYMTWLCKYRSDIVQFQAHLQPHVGEMYQALSQALSSLFDLLEGDKSFAKLAPYLLPEDSETQGLSCLSDPAIPLACQLQFDPVKRKLKPRHDEIDKLDISLDDVSFTRAMDIVTCGLTLAQDTSFPFTTSKITKGSRDLTQIIYVEDGTPAVAPTSVEGMGAVPAVGELTAKLGHLQASPSGSGKRSRPQGSLTGNELKPGISPMAAPPPRVSPYGATESEYSLDSQLHHLVDTLLAPPEKQATSPSQDTSYGMHTNTANEVFGPALTTTSPGPGSATAKSFPSLPWNYFYTPTPQKGGPPKPDLHQAWHSASGQAGSSSAPGCDDVKSPSHSRKESYGQMNQTLTRPSRKQADQFPSGSKQDGSKGSARLPSNEPSPAWTQTTDWGSLQNALMMEQSRISGPTELHSPQAQGSAGPRGSLSIMNTAFPSTAFSENTSSLPPVNSPWGLPPNAHKHMQEPVAPPNAAVQADPSEQGTIKGSPFDISQARPGAYDRQALLDALQDSFKPKRQI